MPTMQACVPRAGMLCATVGASPPSVISSPADAEGICLVRQTSELRANCSGGWCRSLACGRSPRCRARTCILDEPSFRCALGGYDLCHRPIHCSLLRRESLLLLQESAEVARAFAT